MPAKKRGSAKAAAVVQVAMGSHLGNMVCLAADQYPGISKTLQEMAQNAIDAQAKHVGIIVDRKEGFIAVCDDGTGITPEKFAQALLTVGQTVKNRAPGVLGRFGLGLVSPITKCTEMVVMSQPDPDGATYRWTFREKEIRPQRDVSIPMDQDLTALPALGKPFSTLAKEVKKADNEPDVIWRTMVFMNGVTKDRVIGALDPADLREQIQTRLGKGMKARGTTILVMVREHSGAIKTERIDPRVYTGVKLEPYTTRDADAGTVTFELYRALRGASGERRGVVSFAEADAADAVPWLDFRQQTSSVAADDPTLTHALQALGSGYFEGVITATGIDMEYQRNKFVYNAAVLGLAGAISEWFILLGQNLVDEERELQADERYKRLGEQTYRQLFASFGASPGLSRFYESLSDIFPGLPREKRAASAPKEDAVPGPKLDKPKQRVVVEPPSAPPTDPSPSRRRQAASLPTLVYEIGDSTALWVYDHAELQLRINVTHPLWVLLDETDGRHLAKNDRYILGFQKWLLIEVLTALSDDPEMLDFEHVVERITSKQEAIIRILIMQ